MWAVKAGFLDSNVCNDLSLQKLERIEILQSLLNAMQKGWLSDKLTRQLIPMSACFQLSDGDLTDEAVIWLKNTGETNIVAKLHRLGPRYVRYEVLRFIFGKFSPLSTEAVSGQSILLKLKDEFNLEPDHWSKEKSEDLKNKGNEQFRKNNFQLALKWYSKAIKYHPANHVLYGNRAICLIRVGKYLKAVGDGKRATVLKPDWAKGHYRFCEALFLLEQRKKALEANEMAHSLCVADSEGIKELQRQRDKFLLEMKDGKDKDKPDRSKRPGNLKSSNKRSHSTLAKCVEPQCDVDQGSESDQVHDELTAAKEEGKDLMSNEGDAGESDTGILSENKDGAKQMKRETRQKRCHGAAACRQDKLKMKSRCSRVEKTQRTKSDGDLKKELACAISDAHVALTDQHWFNAKQAFLQALDILDSRTSQELSISELDKLLLMYGYATALTEIGQPQELAEATKQFVQIQFSCDEKFKGLVYFGMGRVLLKENRFPEALKQFSEALLMVEKKISSEELNWPTTNVPVKEAQTEYLKDFLEKCIDICRFPPPPDAICRHKIFQDHVKREIYLTDPGFKGFHRVVCNQRCVVEFHTTCWKKFKTATFPDKTDKDFLQKTCFTPDCTGTVCHVVIVGATGRIKCEFESSIVKQTLEKPRIKQQSTAPKSIKIKEERKFKPSKQLVSASDRDHFSSKENVSILESGNKVQAWIEEDYVLRQLGEMRHCFAGETLGVSATMTSLKPWIESDLVKGLDCPVLNVKEPTGLNDVVDILLQRKSRVWARIFIHELSNFADLTPKLLEWAQHLNAQGLKVAKTFIERYAEPLEELDLGPLLACPPLQEALIQRFGTMPDSLFSGAGLTVTEYLRQASPQDMRLFIWTLEGNRDLYPSCHTVLDEYFATDCSYLVIKKTEHENPVNQHLRKNKNKRKKGKEPKPEFVLSGMGSGTLREEKEEDFLYDEDSFMLLDSLDPFSIPGYLRDQVAEFEEEVGGRGRRSLYNIPDPARENLYDYFAQVLEEHGPLKVDHPLLVGELENFPADALNTIKESGGLKPFLLQSLRFIMKDDVIGLMKHVGVLQSVTAKYSDRSCHCRFEDVDEDDGTSLNPLADEFYPTCQLFMNAKTISESQNIAASENWSDYCLKYNQDSSSVPFAKPIHKCRHSPYLQDSCSQIPKHSHLPGGSSETFASGRHFEICGTTVSVPSMKQKDTFLPSNAVHDLKTEGVASFLGRNNGGNALSSLHWVTGGSEQAFSKIGYNVAVNTEAYEILENMKGDMMRKEKYNMECKNKMPQLKNDLEVDNQRRRDDLAHCEKLHEDICQQMEIINKELSLFQQKVDEEMKMYQPEKKENQETLKRLKEQISSLSATNDSVAKDIRGEEEKYETRHTYFTTVSNQLAAEKSNLKGEINRYKHLTARPTRRCQHAWILILENRQAQGLRGLKRCIFLGKSILRRITELSSRYPASGLEGLIDSWRTYVHDAEQKISETQGQYRQQIEMVKDGTTLCSLPQVSVPACPSIPPEPILDPQIPTHTFGPRQNCSHLSAQMLFQLPNQNALQLLDTLDFSEDERTKGQSESARYQTSGLEAQLEMGHKAPRPYSPLRPAGRLPPSHGLTNAAVSRPTTSTLEKMHSTVSQSGIFGAQPERGQRASGPYSPAKQTGTPPVWKCEAAQRQTKHRALNMDDPCIICHEDVNPETVCVLECRHGFHSECIRSWLNTQRTCPTCRKHVLQPDDFPGLPVRLDRPTE
ncbi:hypothetical protein ACEWY4_010140 [Coilia grayii]|uniref:RING-type domain-containing protein n=1 Tax=Coilia grayii TaxID=363190 RepID=A0ABD1K8L4_9TELE